MADAIEQLSGYSKIACNAPAILEGEGVYHILGVFDQAQIALKFYERSRREWIYFFIDSDKFRQYYQNGWIELKQ